MIFAMRLCPLNPGRKMKSYWPMTQDKTNNETRTGADNTSTDISQARPFRTWGMWAVMIGGLAVILVFVQVTLPTLAPGPTAAHRIGEIAGEMKRTAWMTFLGIHRHAPDPRPVPLLQAVAQSLSMVAPTIGVVAIVLALISGVMNENRRYAAYAITLGGGAVIFQMFWWVALIAGGIILLIAILQNLGDIFSL